MQVKLNETNCIYEYRDMQKGIQINLKTSKILDIDLMVFRQDSGYNKSYGILYFGRRSMN